MNDKLSNISFQSKQTAPGVTPEKSDKPETQTAIQPNNTPNPEKDSSLETSIDINVFQKSWFQFLTVLSSWYVICTGCTTTDGWTWTHWTGD